MSECEYERVEGMTDLDVVASMLNNIPRYKNLDGTSYVSISFCEIPCLSAWLSQGLVYTRKEKP